ncbi:hypothetical protein B0H13DRAFT_1850432 [Mycena leptocephala]|nr:hypothetical protein B0H13DRAFT_1850432 [Mycena leptocephala]
MSNVDDGNQNQQSRTTSAFPHHHPPLKLNLQCRPMPALPTDLIQLPQYQELSVKLLFKFAVISGCDIPSRLSGLSRLQASHHTSWPFVKPSLIFIWIWIWVQMLQTSRGCLKLDLAGRGSQRIVRGYSFFTSGRDPRRGDLRHTKARDHVWDFRLTSPPNGGVRTDLQLKSTRKRTGARRHIRNYRSQAESGSRPSPPKFSAP